MKTKTAVMVGSNGNVKDQLIAKWFGQRCANLGFNIVTNRLSSNTNAAFVLGFDKIARDDLVSSCLDCANYNLDDGGLEELNGVIRNPSSEAPYDDLAESLKHKAKLVYSLFSGDVTKVYTLVSGYGSNSFMPRLASSIAQHRGIPHVDLSNYFSKLESLYEETEWNRGR